MIKKCVGCGSILQSLYENKEGFVDEVLDDIKYCKRCFRIINYGDYKIIQKDSVEYENLFNDIKNKKELILFLCDILTLDDTLENLNNFKGKVLLVITKKDLLPKSVKDTKLLKYINDNYNINVIDIVFVSSVKNYNLDLLMSKVNKYKLSNKVYLVGNTNAGKSTLLNKIVKSYGNNDEVITTSKLPNTTLDTIEVKIDDNLTFIDTPGIVLNDNYLTMVNAKDVKLISANKEIKPRTYQMKPNQSILIGDYARIDYTSNHENSFTIYLSNDIKVQRININTNNTLKDLKIHSFNLKDHKDIVISGLLFCKIVKDASINIYVKDGVKVFERNNLI